MSKRTKISAVIPTFNGSKTISMCIDSLIHQSVVPFEIIIVDNASIDNTVEIVRSYINIHPQQYITLITLSANTGVVGGRNAGALKSCGEEILFFDHDMIADYHMVEYMHVLLNKNQSVGIVTPKIFYYEDKNIIWSAGTEIDLISGMVKFRAGIDKGQYDLTEQVAIAPASILVKRVVLRTVGLFNPLYVSVYEDSEFCFRSRISGFETWYEPKGIAYHQIPLVDKMSNLRLLQRLYWIGRNRILFMKTYGKNLFIFFLFQLMLFGYYVVLSFININFQAAYRYIRGIIDGITTDPRKAAIPRLDQNVKL